LKLRDLSRKMLSKMLPLNSNKLSKRKIKAKARKELFQKPQKIETKDHCHRKSQEKAKESKRIKKMKKRVKRPQFNLQENL
jgi:hypothetical protein